MILNILKANAEIKTLTENNDELTGLNEQLKNENAELKKREATVSQGSHDFAAERENLVKGHEEAMKELTEKFTKQISDLEATKKEAQESAGKKAADIVASLGVEPETVKVVKDDLATVSTKGYKVTSHLPKPASK